MRLKRLRERKCDTRKPRRRIVLSCEGNVTEIQYFRHFENLRDDVYIKFVNNRRHKSAPLFVVNALKKYLIEEPLIGADEAWAVIDYDERPEQMIQCVIDVLDDIGRNAHLALSNPNFEFWLLLHFEDGIGIQTKKECNTRLAKYISNYDKNIPDKVFTHIEKAIARAAAIDKHSNTPWPQKSGTTVYKLVKLLMPSFDN